MKTGISLLVTLLFLFSCTQQQHQTSSIFSKQSEDTVEVYDLDDIQESGTLIAGTLSGPDTYFEYHGHGMGLEFLLADAFSLSIGARLQIQVAQDTTELLRMLQEGEIDFIALEGLQDTINNSIPGCPWPVGQGKPELETAIADWWNPGRKSQVLAQFTRRQQTETRRNPRPKWRNHAKGIISDYDDLFRRHSIALGWDWKLLAAQCYQESSFDPNAQSWAGAQGLMQIMPGTARHLGLPASQVFQPEANIAAAARYLKELQNTFNDISDRDEKINFCLAAYNGGPHHIRDAQELCRKYGGNATRWSEVSQWVLNLQYSRYYRDPVVKYGYMRGSETVGYVSSIRSHWRNYAL